MPRKLGTLIIGLMAGLALNAFAPANAASQGFAPGTYTGTWKDSGGFSQGAVTLVVTSSKNGTIAGTVTFTKSFCPSAHPFTGSVSGERVRISADFGGNCGFVSLRLRNDGRRLRGRYTSDPGPGEVSLSRN